MRSHGTLPSRAAVAAVTKPCNTTCQGQSHPFLVTASVGLYKYLLDNIYAQAYSHEVAWEVEYTDEFEAWWIDLSDDQQERLTAGVEKLEEPAPR